MTMNKPKMAEEFNHKDHIQEGDDRRRKTL